jgi:serine/threonine protein phosphatase PrpC
VIVDAFDDAANQAFFAIYDGHGGKEAVEIVSGNLHRLLAQQLKSTESEFEAFETAYSRMDKMVLDENIGSSGCTAVTVLLRTKSDGSRWLYCANVGDSRAILW